MNSVLVGVSGGIDSFAAVDYFRKEKWFVIPLFIVLSDIHKKKLEKVKELFDSQSLKLEVRDERALFKQKIIDYFAQSYKSGITPNPCALCNRRIKFPLLKKYSKETGCDYFSTGHYAKIENQRIFKAKDSSKDQSYFLSTVKKESLEGFHSTTLAELSKESVKKTYREIFNEVEKESQEICFIEDNDYPSFLEENAGLEKRTGNFIDDEGKKIGVHPGYYRYTVGERRNLGMGFNKRMYVKSVDSEKNEVHLTDKGNLKKSNFTMEGIEIFDTLTKKEYSVKTRYRQRDVSGRVNSTGKNLFEVNLNEGIEAITPGQICAVYDDDMVLISGFITKDIW